MGRARRREGWSRRPDCNCPKVLASLVNAPAALPLRLPRAFSLLGPCWVMFF